MPVIALLISLRRLRWLILLYLALGAPLASLAQPADLPSCFHRPTVINGELYADNRRWCPEEVVHDLQIEPLSFTAMEVAPDGTLYATRPLSGMVMVIRDSDGDELPDKMETFADGLTLPNGLAYHAGDLYVSGGANIYRISQTGVVDTLVNDLPSGTGFPSGGITIDGDGRLYVVVGAPCNNCEFDDAERGAILSMNLDGSDRQVFASGFRNPADLAFYRDQLWTLDSAPRQAERNALDELNRLQAGGWYGFPYCLGVDTVNIESEAHNCNDSIAPAMLFGTGAVPSSLAAFPHDLLPGTEDTLIVVLSGEPSQIDIVGYKVIMITFDEADQPLGAAVILPFLHESGRQAYIPYRGKGLYWKQFIHLSELGFGIYPQQPLAVAVSPQGWIYISITGGRIIALRPRYGVKDFTDLYPVWTPMNPNFEPGLASAVEAD